MHESQELRVALAAAQDRERQQGRLLADVTTLAAVQKAQLKAGSPLLLHVCMSVMQCASFTECRGRQQYTALRYAAMRVDTTL